ncbi:MAG TPA: farnesyl diphosphate synthase [Syntrophobacteria bacterium]|nr:farnesyl diphosphate synthase [Syntrophobacteria bacterium]
MATEFDLKSYLEARRLAVEEALEAALPTEDGLDARVVEAMRYSLFAGGKRLRPILCLAAAEAVGADLQEAMPAACAVEMIHTYSLIHDDLPAMDDDDLRRGIPTNHKVFGEAIAILAGDGLLTEAFTLLGNCRTLSADRIVQLVAVISAAAGHRGMVGGQVVDMLWQNRTADLSVVRYMHGKKTAALIAASTQAGALAGGGTGEQVERLGRYGRAVGLAFQIVDDILDIRGDAALLGKKTGVDIARGKATYPAAVGLEQAEKDARALISKALEALAAFDQRAEPLRALARYIVARKQ